jgi:pyruvate dehydrogenase E2 component (dihydrolipoamide acetyltransferase)/2-oxoisovalerate dehydrogenase E2 component (dihydrolipoyl transacylase)
MDFRVPELGEGVYEAELVAWHVKPGDVVKSGQTLAEVMTDKASMDLPSPFAGVIEELRAEPGQQFKIGQVLLTYHAGGKNDRLTSAMATRPREDGVGSDGDPPRRNVTKKSKQPVAAVVSASPSRPLSLATPAPGGIRQPIRAAPSVRLLARQLGIDLVGVNGTGPGGRILASDLASLVRREAPEEAERRLESRKPKADYGTPGQRIKLIGVRRKIAEHLVHAKHTAPHYSYVDECEVTALVSIREQLRESFAEKGVKLTYLPFFVKAVVAALKEVPIVNASLEAEAGEIVLHDRYHIGIATATPAGLVVPVVRDADQKDLIEIAREIERLSDEARMGRPRLEDLRGGTFTITSIGNIGGLISTPIINHPEVAILGVGKIVKRPVYDAAGNIRPADLVYLSFSFDHRVVDGAVGAVFANAVIKRLQTPAALLLGS